MLIQEDQVHWTYKVNQLYAGCCSIWTSHYVPNAVELWAFGIKGALRGKGYGQQFLREIIEHHKGQTIILFVEKTNQRALHIYTKFGFTIVGDYRGGDFAWEMRLEA